jgi:hypothetical protein
MEGSEFGVQESGIGGQASEACGKRTAVRDQCPSTRLIKHVQPSVIAQKKYGGSRKLVLDFFV